MPSDTPSKQPAPIAPAPQTITLKSSRFRAERSDSWRQLERLLQTVESRSTKALSDEELLALPRLYRACLSSLSVARATSLDQSVIRYLESLSERAYYVIYGSQTPLWKRVRDFFLFGWPDAMRAIWRETFVAFSVMLVATLLGFVLVQSDPDWFYSFVDPQLAGERGPDADPETLREVIYPDLDNQDDMSLSVFATSLFAHNSGVAILAFALGFMLGIPTLFLLVMNGVMLGAFLAIHVEKGLGFEIGGWLSIHGTTEILAIVLAGAGGLHLGRAVAFPGERSRLASLAASGDVAGRVLGGVIIMLCIAGLLEGFPRQTVQSDLWRYGIGWSLFVFWMLYFYLPRRRPPSVDQLIVGTAP